MITHASKKGLHFERGAVTQIKPHDDLTVVDATWDAETLTLTAKRAPLEDGTPLADVVTVYTQAQLDAIEDALFTSAPVILSLRERLRSVTGTFPASLKASFPFERVAYWLSQGDEAAAQAVIEGVDVSGYPQEVQNAKAALLAEF